MYRVLDLYHQHGQSLGLTLYAGKEGVKRSIKVPEVHRPGLALTGYLKAHCGKRLLVVGKIEISYLKDISSKKRHDCLKAILKYPLPAIIIARGYLPPAELVYLCEDLKVPLFRSKMITTPLLNQLSMLLNEEFAPYTTLHGTLVDIFGVGVLIQGKSSVGKSEAALGLLERGHRLVSDDIVHVHVREGTYVEGKAAELTQNLMEIRGLGIINVAHLYGAVCVRSHKAIDTVVRLEIWDDQTAYDRVGLDVEYCEILKIKVPQQILPVRPGRDVVQLLETIALNFRLRKMGYNSAKELKTKLLKEIERKHKRVKQAK